MLEVSYLMTGTGGMGNEVLAGDLNGDGAGELVVQWGGMRKAIVSMFFVGLSSISIRMVCPQPWPLSRPRRRIFVLGANYPNPLDIRPRLSPYRCPTEPTAVAVAIYNLVGQLVRQVRSGPLAAIEHRLTWDGRDGQGQPVASGAYLYQGRVLSPSYGTCKLGRSSNRRFDLLAALIGDYISDETGMLEESSKLTRKEFPMKMRVVHQMNKSMLRTLQAATILTVLVLLLSINLGQAEHDDGEISLWPAMKQNWINATIVA